MPGRTQAIRASRAGSSPAGLESLQLPSKRAQKVQQILLRGIAQMLEVLDDPVRLRWGELLRAATGVFLDSLPKIGRAPVVQQKDPLTQTPKRRGAEFVGPGVSLQDVVGELGSHPVHSQIGEQRERLVAQRRDLGHARLKRRRVT